MAKKDPSRRFTNRKPPKKKPYNRFVKGSKPLSDSEKEEKLKELLPTIYSRIIDEPCDYREHPTEAKLWCRHAWWSGKYSVNEISEFANVPLSTLKSWIRGTANKDGWIDEKNKADRRAMARSVQSNSTRMDKLMNEMLTVMEKTVSAVIYDNRELTVDEFTKITNAFEKIFKLRQLELGKPTEIFANEDGVLPTWSEIRKKIEEVAVPVFEIVESPEREVVDVSQ